MTLTLADYGISYYFSQVELGITLGAMYALVALGYTLVYGIIELINFAHGEVFMWGTVISLAVAQTFGFTHTLVGVSLIVAIVLLVVIAAGFSATLNYTIERVAYRRLRNAPRLAPLISAIGISFILQQAAIYRLGPSSTAFPTIFPQGNLVIGPVFIIYRDIFIVALAVLLMFGLDRFIQLTKLGKAMRATAQDPEAAALMGVNINQTISTTFIIGGALAGAAGVIYSLFIGQVSYDAGFQLGLVAFTAAVLGGIGNIRGAVLGGFLIGLIQTATVLWVPGGIKWSQVAVFAVLILILAFRPSGLLGQQVPDKV